MALADHLSYRRPIDFDCPLCEHYMSVHFVVGYERDGEYQCDTIQAIKVGQACSCDLYDELDDLVEAAIDLYDGDE